MNGARHGAASWHKYLRKRENRPLLHEAQPPGIMTCESGRTGARTAPFARPGGGSHPGQARRLRLHGLARPVRLPEYGGASR